MASSRERFQVRNPYGDVQHLTGSAAGGFFDNAEDAITACRTLNAAQDPSFQYVVVSVIHPTP